jgi:PAT family beta-lactamase induction signal transducer AmpG
MNPPLFFMICFGFLSGLPLPLTIFTLQQWFTTYGISLHAIGFTAWVGLPYTLKFLWSAAFDRPPPGRFGRRRGWLLIVQPLLAMSCAGLALTDPGHRIALTLGAALLVAFFSASQDILIDAWRIESFAADRQGAALAAYIWGYRGATRTRGSGASRVTITPQASSAAMQRKATCQPNTEARPIAPAPEVSIAPR